MITTHGLQQAAIRLGSNIGIPGYLALGSGSGIEASTNIILVAERDRNIFDSRNFSGAQELITRTSFSASEMSGLNLREFGVFVEAAANTGSCWQREGFDAIAFDGTNELVVEIQWQTF